MQQLREGVHLPMASFVWNVSHKYQFKQWQRSTQTFCEHDKKLSLHEWPCKLYQPMQQTPKCNIATLADYSGWSRTVGLAFLQPRSNPASEVDMFVL
jgi:hypothetical protein